MKTGLYEILKKLSTYHFSPVDGEINGNWFSINPTFEVLSYVLNRNHLLVGDPGWGKTTSTKIVS